MNSRDEILAAIRANLPRVARPLPNVPLFDDETALEFSEAEQWKLLQFLEFTIMDVAPDQVVAFVLVAGFP